jgi:cytoskeletal protein RodZ
MPSIGDTLREARMRQRLDIADVEAKTKIRAKYLRALENEEFGMLPGPTFVKTFLRSYAEVLGLDPHLLVEDYRARYEPRDEMETMQPLGPPGFGRDRRRRAPPPGPWLLAGLALVAVLGTLLVIGLVHAYLIWHGDILVAYALVGMIVFWCRGLHAWWCTVLGLAALAIPSAMLLFAGLVFMLWP